MSKMLKRRTSVNHLYQAACLVVNPSHEAVYEQMAQVKSRNLLLSKFYDVM